MSRGGDHHRPKVVLRGRERGVVYDRSVHLVAGGGGEGHGDIGPAHGGLCDGVRVGGWEEILRARVQVAGGVVL